MSKKVLVPIADGTEELEAVTIIDVLRRAGASVTVASVSGASITASRNTRIIPDAFIGECIPNTYDLIVLPGGMPGAENLSKSPELIKMLNQQANAKRFYAAICAAPAVVLAKHGFLKGKQATCYPSLQDQLPQNAPGARVVVDGNCITSQGPGTAIEFSLKLVELLFGHVKAEQIAEDLLAV